MRKTAIIGISILSVFILCSLPYQPIVADESIETITQVKESKAFDLDVDELKELYNKLIELKFQSDCGCGNDDIDDREFINWHFPCICTLILLPIALICFMIWFPLYRRIDPPLLLVYAVLIAEEIDCWWLFN